MAALIVTDPGGLPAALPKLAAEVLDATPEAQALANLIDSLPAVPAGSAAAPTASRRLDRLLQRAAAAARSPMAGAALRQELAALPLREREALAATAAVRERAMVEAAPELAWLRSLQAASDALGDARPAPPETPPSMGLTLLLPSLPAGAPRDRLCIRDELRHDAPDHAVDERTAGAILELGLPTLGPTVASLALRGGVLEVRIELADAARSALVTARLHELSGSLAALGFAAVTSVGPPRGAALDGNDRAAPLAPVRAVSVWA